MDDLSIYLESIFVQQHNIEELLQKSISQISLPEQETSELKPWLSKLKNPPIYKQTEHLEDPADPTRPLIKAQVQDQQEIKAIQSLAPKSTKKANEETLFGLKPSSVRLNDLTEAQTLGLDDPFLNHDYELVNILGKGEWALYMKVSKRA